MKSLDFFGVTLVAGDAAPPPHDNDNWFVCSQGRTPAETLQFFKRIRTEMQQELAEDFALRRCPKHRMIWESVNAAIACVKWQFYRRKSG